MQIRTKQLKMVDGTPKWVFDYADRDFKVGDCIHFLCNGRGRGGHYQVTATVTKVNNKTLKATEATGSYSPGTLWSIEKDFNIFAELPSEVTK